MYKSLITPAIIVAALALPAAGETVQITSETATPSLLSELRSELRVSDAAETVFEARRQARQTAEKAENYLNSLGYYAPEFAFAVEPGTPPIGRVLCRSQS